MLLNNEEVQMFLYEQLYPKIKQKKQKDYSLMNLKFEVAVPRNEQTRP